MAATGKSTKSNTRKKSAPRKNEQEMMGRQVAGLIVIGVGILALYLLLSGQGARFGRCCWARRVCWPTFFR